MSKQLTQLQMQKRATLMRLRNEASILRAYWLNEVAPAVEDEFDARIASGEELPLQVPEANEFAKAYVQHFFEINSYQEQERRKLGA